MPKDEGTVLDMLVSVMVNKQVEALAREMQTVQYKLCEDEGVHYFVGWGETAATRDADVIWTAFDSRLRKNDFPIALIVTEAQ